MGVIYFNTSCDPTQDPPKADSIENITLTGAVEMPVTADSEYIRSY